jgi:hypothetical protein
MHALDNFKLPADDSTTVKKKHSKLKIELNYASNNTYKGRADTSNTPIISPFIKYTGKSKFFVQGSLVNVPGEKKIFDEMDLGVGKKIRFSDSWDGSVSYSHYFFDSNVARIKAGLQNNFSSFVGYDWDILYSQLYFDWSEGSNSLKTKNKKITNTRRTSDVTFTLVNSHQFNFYVGKTTITLMPEADILYGTQNFLASYKGKTDPANKKYQDQASKFTLTGYMFTLAIILDIKNFTIDLSPYYTIPKNIPGSGSTAPYFVMSASIYYTITGKK